nr:MAG TPA: hypothetical protein [Caudoviricetes sp.]
MALEHGNSQIFARQSIFLNYLTKIFHHFFLEQKFKVLNLIRRRYDSEDQ